MKNWLTFVLLLAACGAEARDRCRNPRGRTGDCSSSFATGTAAAIAALQSTPCECVQVSRTIDQPSAGILINERGVETLSGDPSPQYAYCTKSSVTSLHVGDLVPCSVNVPRIRPVNDDGTGAFVVLSERRRKNYTIYSSEFDNVFWNPTGVVSAAPTIIPNAALAPDGTMTADMACFDATSAVGLSELFARVSGGSGCPVASNSDGGNLVASVFAAGATDGGFNIDGGFLDLATYTGAAWENTIHAVRPYLATGSPDGGATGWTRLIHANFVQDSSGAGYFLIGNASLINGGVARPRQCIYLAKAQCELGISATSPIDTVSRQALAYADVVSVQEPVGRSANERTAAVGNSLFGLWTVGETSTELFSTVPYAYAADAGRTVDVWAHNGDKIADAILQWSTYGSRTRASRILFEAGVNDIVGDSADGATSWAVVEAWINARAVDGVFVTISGLSPFGGYSAWSAPKQTEADEYNTLGAAFCGANPTKCTFVNLRPTLEVTDGGRSLRPEYAAPDGLHYTQEGAYAHAGAIKAVSP